MPFFNSVVASSGRYLYMKMKKPTENKMLTVAIQPLISNFFSGALPASSFCNSSNWTFAENRSARKPSVIAWPSVITPRSTGHAIHGCFSESRSSGSLCVESSPDGLRQVMAHACGLRIITPSSTAWPPTSVSFAAFERRQKLHRHQKPPQCSEKLHID